MPDIVYKGYLIVQGESMRWRPYRVWLVIKNAAGKEIGYKTSLKACFKFIDIDWSYRKHSSLV
jgi:hypothetical protein